MMTISAQRLEVRGIPEQIGIPLMFHNVVNLKGWMNHPTLGTGISRLYKHTFPFPLPTFPIIQTPDDPVRALLFLDPRMGRTAPLGHQHATAGGHTELHV